MTFYIRINIRDFIIYWTVHMNDEITTLFISLCMLINIEMIIVMHCKIRTIQISILFWSEIFGEFFRQSSFHLASSTCIFTCLFSIFHVNEGLPILHVYLLDWSYLLTLDHNISPSSSPYNPSHKSPLILLRSRNPWRLYVEQVKIFA